MDAPESDATSTRDSTDPRLPQRALRDALQTGDQHPLGVGAGSLALLAATGAQTETVPPSLVLITIGSAAVFGVMGGMITATVLAIAAGGLFVAARPAGPERAF